jgi:hypothetical protein
MEEKWYLLSMKYHTINTSFETTFEPLLQMFREYFGCLLMPKYRDALIFLTLLLHKNSTF